MGAGKPAIDDENGPASLMGRVVAAGKFGGQIQVRIPPTAVARAAGSERAERAGVAWYCSTVHSAGRHLCLPPPPVPAASSRSRHLLEARATCAAQGHHACLSGPFSVHSGCLRCLAGKDLAAVASPRKDAQDGVRAPPLRAFFHHNPCAEPCLKFARSPYLLPNLTTTPELSLHQVSWGPAESQLLRLSTAHTTLFLPCISPKLLTGCAGRRPCAAGKRNVQDRAAPAGQLTQPQFLCACLSSRLVP